METVLRAGCEAGPHERRLLGDLNLNYNKLERPVADEAQPVQLKFGLTLQQIMDVVSKISLHSAHHSQPRCCLQDEKNQIITTNLWLNWVRGLARVVITVGQMWWQPAVNPPLRARRTEFQQSVKNTKLTTGLRPVHRRQTLQFHRILVYLCSVQEWTDVNLKWNESEYGNIKDIRMPPNLLWKPDILMYNRSAYHHQATSYPSTTPAALLLRVCLVSR